MCLALLRGTRSTFHHHVARLVSMRLLISVLWVRAPRWAPMLHSWCCGPGVADYRERLWEIGRCPRILAGFAEEQRIEGDWQEEQRLEGDRQEVSQDLAAGAGTGRRCSRTLPLALPLPLALALSQEPPFLYYCCRPGVAGLVLHGWRCTVGVAGLVLRAWCFSALL